MTAPTQWSKDNPFADPPQQADSFSSDNPFVDQTPVASTSAQPPVAQQPGPEKSWQTKALEAGVGAGQAGLDIAEGAGRALVDLGKGVAEFAAQTAEPLNPDYKPGTYAEETKKGLKLGGEAAVAPFVMGYQGGKQAIEDPTLKGKAYGATTAALGLLGLHEYAAKAKKALIPKAVDPVTGKPPAGPPSQPTPTEVLDKQGEVDKLAQQEKELSEKKAKSKNSLLRAANAWNTLSADQRRSVINGLADEQYNRRWVDLSSEAKVAVKKALIPPESDTNSYTSPDAPAEATGSVPSAQGVGPEATTPTAPAAPTQEGQGSTADKIEALLREHKKLWDRKVELTDAEQTPEVDAEMQSINKRIKEGVAELDQLQSDHPDYQTKAEQHSGDISYMDLPTLRAERERAEAKLQQMDIQNDSPTLQEHGKHEREFWQKYKNDLESAMVKKMGPGSTTPESAAKNAPPDEGPDIAPVHISVDDAMGGTFAYDIFNPGKLDASGNPKLMFRKGEKITPEAIKKLGKAGYQHFTSDRGEVAIEDQKRLGGVPLAVTNLKPEVKGLVDRIHKAIRSKNAEEGNEAVKELRKWTADNGGVVLPVRAYKTPEEWLKDMARHNAELFTNTRPGTKADRIEIGGEGPKVGSPVEGKVVGKIEPKHDPHLERLAKNLANAKTPEEIAKAEGDLTNYQEISPGGPKEVRMLMKSLNDLRKGKGSPDDVKKKVDDILAKLREWDVDSQLYRADAIDRIEKSIDRLKESQKRDPGNHSAYAHQIEQYYDMLLDDRVIHPDLKDRLDEKLKQIADKEWSHTKGRTDFLKSVPREAQENFEDIVAKLRRGEKPLTMAFDHEQAIDALLKAGAKYPGPEEGGQGALQSGGPAGPTTKGPEATKGSEGPTPGGSEATTKETNESTSKFPNFNDDELMRAYEDYAQRAKDPQFDPRDAKDFQDLADAIQKELNDRQKKADEREATTKGTDSTSEYKQYANDVKQLHEDLTSRKIDRTEWRKRADALAERKKALDEKYDNDPASRLAEDPLNYGKTDSNANPEDYPQEDTPSLEDAHQIESLVNEPPPNTLELKYRESLNKMDLDQLDEQIDKARKLYDEQKISDADYRTLINDIADAKKSLKAKEMPKSVIPPKFNMPDTYNKDLSKFNDAQLSAAKRSLASMIQSEEAQRNPKLLKVLKEELNRMLDYDSEQRRKKEGGFLRLSFKRRTIKRADQSALPHWEQNLAKRIGLEEDPVNPYSVMDRIRMAYARIFRQSEGIYQAEKRSGKKLAAHESPSVMAQLSNGFLVQVEEFERGNGPFVPDEQGGYIATGALPLNKIAAMVGDDVERLGWLAMARRELWERAEKNRTIGLDPVASQLMYVNTPDIYHRAADALADYMHSLVDYDIWGGLVDPAERNSFTSRFYAPIERIFGAEIQGAGASNITPRGQGKSAIGGDNPVKRFKGSTGRMRNPYETAMNMTARNIRAANQNHAIGLLRDLAVENPKAYLGWMEPADPLIRAKVQAELRAKAEAAKNALGEEGQDLTVKDIERLIGTMGDDALAIRDNVVNLWHKGQLEHWVVHPELAYAIKSMGPHELGIVTRLAGVPARAQRWGIVNHPVFIMTMSMVDTFQAAINSNYGFVPVLSSFRGWWAAMTNHEEFVNYRRGGGGNASLTSQQYAKSTTSLSDVVGAPESQRPIDQAVHQIRTLHPLKAWRTIVAPVAEAARVAEYLHARGRGASVVEAVYAAKNVVGDYSQMGGAMHALNHMALFLNPSLQVLDVTRRVIQKNPARWFLRSSILGAAAYVLYMANDGDQDIEDLRQTPSGQRYVFFRTPSGEIVKSRKPFLEGSIFMSGVEAAMDQMKGKNPEAFKLWRTAVIQELKINLLPTIGVIPAQIWANKDWNTDAPISPESDQSMSPMFQAGPNTGSAARIIGKETNQSPALIEWLARNQFGYLGSEGITALEAAINWRASGELPIPEELPFLNKVLVKYPSSNVRPIRDFYDRAKDVERVAADMEYMANHEPEMLPHYMESHPKEMILLDQWKDTRKELSEYRKSIEDVNSAPPDVIAPSVKHIYTDEFLRIMIESARAANLMHDAVKDAITNNSTP